MEWAESVTCHVSEDLKSLFLVPRGSRKIRARAGIIKNSERPSNHMTKCKKSTLLEVKRKREHFASVDPKGSWVFES